MKNGDEYALFRDYKIMPSTAGLYDLQHSELYSMGSGTFVSIGRLRGLLTCAHVIDAILTKPQIQLVVHSVRALSRSFVLNVRDHCDYIKFGPSRGQEGPDLGFLHLPTPFFDQISHLVSVKSLETGRDQAFALSEPSQESITAVVGMIHEWTEENKKPGSFVVRGLMNSGNIDDAKTASDGHDLFSFRPVADETFIPPRSYGGTSGGGLWRIYPKPDDGSEIAYRLIGVAFYETGDRQIICHGQASIYVKLLNAIRERWPDAF